MEKQARQTENKTSAVSSATGSVQNIQRKMQIGGANDPSEHEADTTADKVMSMPTLSTSANGNVIQRCAECEKEEKQKIHRKPLASFIQRKESSSGTIASGAVSSQINASKGNGAGIDSPTRSFMETRFGTDFSNVNIHTDSDAIQMNRELSAKAFTVGNDIYFNQREYQPGSDSGRHLLAHELTHTIQQSGGSGAGFVQRTPDEENCKVAKITTGEAFDRPKVNVGADSQNIFIVVSWCRGDNVGDIKLGADVPAEAVSIANKILSSAQTGNLDNLAKDLKGENLTPFLNVVIKKGNLSITAHGEVSVGAGGVKNISADAAIRWRDFVFKPSFNKGSQGTSGGLIFEYSPPPEKKECKATIVPLKVYCNCTTPPGIGTLDPLTVKKRNKEELYVHFKKAKYEERNIIPPIDHNPEFAKLEDLLTSGYTVTEISGYTSPEGPLDEGVHFEGNTKLSEERATTVKKWIENYCARKFGMRGCAKDVLINITEKKDLGQKELYGSIDGKELFGRPLAENTIKEFMSSDEEKRYRTESFLKEVQGLKAEQEAEKIYPFLRRVKIKLERTDTLNLHTDIPLPPDKAFKECPPDIANEAKRNFMLTH